MVKGVLDNILNLHFMLIAKAISFDMDCMSEMVEKLDFVINKVSSELPYVFPTNICDPILNGLKERAKHLSIDSFSRARN
ncbi:hypothetical protein [Shewanella xiamenensis]|uniref:hypothetical protein n=1 Tax=Shewanella xiamenensis TaxID=332186 RepID=UPI0015593E23|nr:hypothetical protein [Shewanella xiamenensis]